MTEDMKAAAELFQKQAELFLSVNLLLAGGVAAQHFTVLHERHASSKTRLICMSCAALGPSATLLFINAYNCSDAMQQLLVFTRRGASGEVELLKLIASAPFGHQFVCIALACCWALLGLSWVYARTDPTK